MFIVVYLVFFLRIAIFFTLGCMAALALGALIAKCCETGVEDDVE
tara:strand:+ start:625 stop:759 length:135 start_codon:yes stop_codon:yes gene_type:complete